MLCDNESKYLVIRVEECKWVVGFWHLITVCFRAANYYSSFLLLGDVSCPERLVDDITQVVLYDCPILRVEFAP